MNLNRRNRAIKIFLGILIVCVCLYFARVEETDEPKAMDDPMLTAMQDSVQEEESEASESEMQLEESSEESAQEKENLREAKPEADDSFFSDAAILGNSLIEGLAAFSNLNTVTFYSGVSMTVVSAVNTADVELYDGYYGTQLDAMAQQSYGKVYIELGINEIGGNLEDFIRDYGDMIDRIREDQMNADIYIMAVLPVSKARSESGSSFNMKNIHRYNAALETLAEEKDCYYLDICTPMMDAEGYLAAEDTWDGIHLNVEKYQEWEKYIRTHYAG